MNDLHSVIQYVFNDPYGAEAIEKIKSFAQRKETCILLNLSEFNIHGDHRSSKLTDALEWLFRGHDGYYAFDPQRDRDNQISFYNLSPWGGGTFNGLNKLSNNQKEALAIELNKKSFPIFTLMKYFGYNVILRKCIQSDLSLSHGYGLKTLAAVSEAKERALRNEPFSKKQMFFYFKDRSCYHLYSVSKKWYPKIQEFLTAYGAPPKEV